MILSFSQKNGGESIYRYIKDLIKQYIPGNAFLYRYLYLLARKVEAKKRIKPRTLLRFDIHLADHCNLKCKGCEHFSPLAEEKYLDVDIFERDCARISELTNKNIEYIGILGGEPLLHPRITVILNIARKYFNTSVITIVTNGILLLKQTDDFWENCQKNNINIGISRYPIKIDFKAIKYLAELHGVKMSYFGGDNIPIKTMWRRPIDINGKQKVKNSFSLCYMANSCIQLRDGKLYTCATVAYIQYFNNHFNQNLQVTEKDYIDIYKVKNINEIFNFLCKPIPFCRYCNIKKTVLGIDWGVSKKEITEWIEC